MCKSLCRETALWTALGFEFEISATTYTIGESLVT